MKGALKIPLSIALVISFASPNMVALAGMTPDDLPGVPLEVVRPIDKPIKTINLKPKLTKTTDPLYPLPTSGLPGIPDASPVIQPTSSNPAQKQAVDKQLYESTKVALNVMLGENMILPISSGHPNRLLTPFDTPKVTTFSDAEISVDNSVIYVTPNSNDVVTMFITEKDGDQQAAVSLTLVPKAIPPREVRLLVSGGKRQGGATGHSPGFSNAKASEWEQNQEYTEALKMTMRELAMNRIPAGYGLRNPVDSDPRVNCKIPGLKLESGQTLDGHNVIVIVNKATNTNAAPLEVNAGACYRPDVLSVAVWPHILLQPGQATELYVLFKRPDPKAQTSTRPSLLSRGK